MRPNIEQAVRGDREDALVAEEGVLPAQFATCGIEGDEVAGAAPRFRYICLSGDKERAIYESEGGVNPHTIIGVRVGGVLGEISPPQRVAVAGAQSIV